MRVHARAFCGQVLICVVEGDVPAEGRALVRGASDGSVGG